MRFYYSSTSIKWIFMEDVINLSLTVSRENNVLWTTGIQKDTSFVNNKLVGILIIGIARLDCRRSWVQFPVMSNRIGIRVARSLVFCVMFCGSLLVPFIWEWYCLSFLNLRLLITSLVSSKMVLVTSLLSPHKRNESVNWS